MSFRCRQKYRPAFGSSAFEVDSVELPSGEFKFVMVDECQKTMPKPELFDLKNQIESGLDLEEVNSKILSAKSVNAEQVIRKYTKKDSKQE